jgi:hypothetical protein
VVFLPVFDLANLIKKLVFYIKEKKKMSDFDVKIYALGIMVFSLSYLGLRIWLTI